MLRKALLFGVVFGFSTFSSFSGQGGPQPSHAQSYTNPAYANQAYAQGYAQGSPQGYTQNYAQAGSSAQHLWYAMSPGDRLIVDRLARDFYERSLRYAQTQAIESHTARAYTGATPADRAAYRGERRSQYRQLNQDQQRALQNTKRPSFTHLSEAQKWPFREHALYQLGAVGAIHKTQGRPVRPGI